MIRALLAWELGGGQGHIHRLAAIARRLETYGIEPVFALRRANAVGIDFPWKAVQAPMTIWKALDGLTDDKSYLFTDILYMCGFSSQLTLRFHIEAWQNLINLVKPALIIAEFAPALVLAASGKAPTIVLGTGFTVPPPVADFPPIREPVPISSMRRGAQVVEAIRQVTGECDVIGQLLNGDRSFIFSIPELDPYKDVRVSAEYVGIHNAPLPQNLGNALGASWGYISEDWPHYSLVVNTLNPQCIFGELENVLDGKSLAIHHGGYTTSIACLLTGIPQILLPQHLEQGLNALALERLGVARLIEHPTAFELEEARGELHALFHNATAQAQNLSRWNQNYVDRVVQSCISFA